MLQICIHVKYGTDYIKTELWSAMLLQVQAVRFGLNPFPESTKVLNATLPSLIIIVFLK